MRKVSELKGYKSLRALNAFSALMLGLKMLPAYMEEDYQPFLDRIQAMPPADQKKMIREAAMFVQLEKDEVDSLIAFCSDKNGVAYDDTNMHNLGPDELVEVIVAVCSEVAKIKINFVSEDEKKN